MTRDSKSSGQFALFGLALAGLAAGGLLHLLEAGRAGRWTWAGSTTLIVIPTFVSVVRGLLGRDAGVDLIAVLAMVGALVFGEYLAGAIIAVMLTGGTALEHFAIARARRELSALLTRTPRTTTSSAKYRYFTSWKRNL